MSAGARFNNDLRRRPESDIAQIHLTPGYILDRVRLDFNGEIGLDPCTTPDNPCAAVAFYSPPLDGCSLTWDYDQVFVNPPYGEARTRWVDRCILSANDGLEVILLIPAHTDTRIFQKALTACNAVVFCKGRVKFGVPRLNGRQMAASHGSAIFGFNNNLDYCSTLGQRMEVRHDA